MNLYQLEQGPAALRKINCPHCGRRSFTRYINTETNEYIDDTCGRCDHEQSCGYHLSPRDFFSQNTGYRHDPALHVRPRTPRQPPKPRPLCTHSMGLVEKLHSAKSNFVRWMTSLVKDKEQAKHAWELYKLGATAQNEVIFWQIDAQNQVRGGKIMQYGPDGHRTGYPSWIHTSLKADGNLPQDWTLTQCLFGEHLLPQFPDKPVCIVESEKTAVVMSMFCPKFVWLATGGCNNLRISDMKLLEGRRVIVYPDSGKYIEWLEQVRNCALAYVTVIDYVEQYPPNTDILDIALAELEETPLKPLPSKENIASNV